MAEMIPERLPRSASQGDQRVFAALQKLPDDVIVYYEPHICLRRPDFVVIIPTVGLLIIEVKGWLASQIQQADPQQVTVLGQTYKHPLVQARDYMFRLMDECRRFPETRRLLVHDSQPHLGRFTFPFGHLVVLANTTADQLSVAGREQLARIFPAERTVTRDQLLAWDGLDGQAILSELARYFDPRWPIAPMPERQINVLRAVVHPEIVIGAPSAADNNAPAQPDEAGQSELKILDLRQERNANAIGEGHRIVYGVAGSGKTVLLIARAKLLAVEKSRRILVTCFNRQLARYIAGALDKHDNVEVVHFHEWGRQLGVPFNKQLDAEDREPYGERLLAVLDNGSAASGAYDAVLVDEAQDFGCSWLKCLKLALKEPDDGDFLIVGDGSQTVYRTRPFTWADAGIKAQGRVISSRLQLDINYRNTAEILAVARPFAGAASPDSDADGPAAIRSLAVSPDGAVRRGPWPTLIKRADRRAEVDGAICLATEWVRSGIELTGKRIRLEPNEIAILYPHLHVGAQPLLDELQAQLAAVGIPVARLSGARPHAHPHASGLKLSNMHSIKGLQFRAVIVIWADLLPSTLRDRTLEGERSLMYVALTRAEDVLAIIYSGSSTFVGEIGAAVATGTG